MNLHVFDDLPEGFLEMAPADLASVLPGPSLIRIPGETGPPLFVATLLHGNEPTGFRAIQRLLIQHRGRKKLPRGLTFFLGNVTAAQANVRHLPDQPDYNRIWNGGPLPEHRLAREVIETMKRDGLFASIDVHNTSGRNPHYACINKLVPGNLNLARLYSKTLVYFIRPHGVLSKAFAEFCTSITIECGKPDDPLGMDHVTDFLDKCLHLARIPDSAGEDESPRVYHSIARIQVPHHCRIGFHRDGGNKDFCFVENLDSFNFAEQPENTLLGWRFNPEMKLSVVDENGREVADHFILYAGDEIRLKRSVVPSMFTTDSANVHQDCLGYLMQPYVIT